MKKIPIINSFKSVVFDTSKNPLVICDIDHTFIKCAFDFHKVYSFLGGGIKYNPAYIVLHHDTIDFMSRAYNEGFVMQSDPEGFKSMLEKVENMGGKLIFLTARGVGSHEKTMSDLTRAGLDRLDRFEFHYTNNQISKGEYLKRLGIVSKFEHVSFIDDNQLFLASVYKIFPQINCYLFRCS